MNITHIKSEKPDGDMLKEIFNTQKQLHLKFKEIEKKNGIYIPDLDRLDINKCKDQDYLKSLVYRIISELVEMTECLKNKPWKHTQLITDEDHFKEELSDAFHFFIEFCIVVGLSAEDLFDLYFRKSKVNDWRIATKY